MKEKICIVKSRRDFSISHGKILKSKVSREEKEVFLNAS